MQKYSVNQQLIVTVLTWVKTEEIAHEMERLVEANTLNDLKVIGKIDLNAINQRTRPKKKSKRQLERERKARVKQQKAAAAERELCSCGNDGNGIAGLSGVFGDEEEIDGGEL